MWFQTISLAEIENLKIIYFVNVQTQPLNSYKK